MSVRGANDGGAARGGERRCRGDDRLEVNGMWVPDPVVRRIMLRRHPMLDAFEKEQMRKEPPDYFRNLRIFEALYEEARQLGVLPPADPLEGIEVDIRLARALNRVRHHIDSPRPDAD